MSEYSADRLLRIEHRDAADRLDWIEHGSLSDPNNAAVLLRIEYAWNTDNTVATRTEIDNTVEPATTTVVTFGYDGRKRLISERRVLDPNVVVYALAYTYDQLGNRLAKLDSASGGRLALYFYDTDPDNRDPSWPTNNNRLLWYKEYGPEDPNTAQRALVRTVRYTYYVTGHVSNITIKDQDPNGGSASDPNNPYNWYRDLALFYDVSGQLRYAVWDRWRVDPNAVIIEESYTKLARRDFVGEEPRERVWTQSYVWDDDPNTPASGWVEDGPGRWVDYLGGQPHQDFTTAPSEDPNGAGLANVTELRRYLGAAEQPLDPNDPSVPLGTQWRHGDLIASTMLLTDEAGSAASTVQAYTAFMVGTLGRRK